MEKSLANKILTLTKKQWNDKSPWKGWVISSPYEISIPKSIESLPIDTDFLRALLVQNRNSFEEWGKMDDSKIIIPTIKTYDIVTTFTGSEIVKRDYGHRLTGYDEYDIESRLNNCDPCWDEGDELDAEWMDREGDWELTNVEQVTEDINRIKEMMGIIVEYNDMDASPTDNNDLCDELTINSIDELLSKLRGMNIPKKDKPKIINLIKKMKKETELLDSDLDISNTYLRYIQNILCTYSKEDLQNLDELKTVNESKMSEINLEGYKKKAIEEGNKEWVEILDRFPDEFQREIIDERPEGSKSDIKSIKNWKLDPNYPITMNLLNLLQTKSVKEAIGRTPRHVMEMIKTNPRYRLELKDVEHISDTEVGRKFGLKSDEIFDQNPERYEEYANYDPETAEPSTMVNGELYWGMGRLIAALLRGDLTIKVWAVHDFTTNRP